MNDIKIFLRRAFRLAIFLPFIWFGFIIVWGTIVPEEFSKNLIYAKAPGFMDLRLQEANGINDVDLLIIGSSHVYRGIDPRSFETLGIKAFNLGSSLQTPMQSEYLLKRYLDQMNPKLVLFEVGYKTFSSDGIEGALDVIISSDLFDWDLVKMAIEINDMRVYNTLAYTFFRKKMLDETRREYLVNHIDKYVAGGFVERMDQIYTGPETFNNTRMRLELDQQRSFERCLDYIRSRGIEAILIQTPILKEYYTSIENMSVFNDYFNSLSEYHFYDFNSEIYRQTKYFYDHHHLNAFGVQRFNRDLINVIRPHLQRHHQTNLNSEL